MWLKELNNNKHIYIYTCVCVCIHAHTCIHVVSSAVSQSSGYVFALEQTSERNNALMKRNTHTHCYGVSLHQRPWQWGFLQVVKWKPQHRARRQGGHFWGLWGRRGFASETGGLQGATLNPSWCRLGYHCALWLPLNNANRISVRSTPAPHSFELFLQSLVWPKALRNFAIPLW